MSPRDRWSRLSQRERVLVVLAVVVIVFGAGWPLLWQPITHDLDLRAREVDALGARTRALRQAAEEIAVLRRNAKPVRTADLRSAVEQASAARGLRNLLTSIDASEGRVRLTFAAIDIDALAPLIEALGRDELLFVREATLVARVEPGTVRAELTLARPETR